MRMGHLISTVAWPGLTRLPCARDLQPRTVRGIRSAPDRYRLRRVVGVRVYRKRTIVRRTGLEKPAQRCTVLGHRRDERRRTILLVIAVSCTIAAIGIITALIRRRWWLAGQIAVFAVVCLAVTRIKGLLPRPFIINTESPAANSAPSGHTMLAAACAVILLLTVPRAVRALAGVDRRGWAVTVGVSVIYGQWHRPSDVAMSILLVAGLALLALALRASRHGRAGRRVLLSEQCKSSAAC